MLFDGVLRRGGFWYCRVNGTEYGAYICREYALAALRVQRIRAAWRKAF